MSVTYDDQAEKAELKVKTKTPAEEKYYQRPSEKELADCRFCRLFIVASFVILLLALLITSIVLIVLTDKCSKEVKPVPKDASVAYQVSVKAFADSDSNGQGDLIGVKERLDWIAKEIGPNKLILSDIVSEENFTLNNRLGTEDDLKVLLKACHDRKMKVLVQMNPTVVSATSAWFQESKKETSKNFWFIWRQHNDTNNWVTIDNKTAWHKKSNISNVRYYSYYGKDLPALNYNDPHVREEIEEILLSWLDKGVDGFFLTSVARLGVDPNLKFDKDTSQSHDVLASFYRAIQKKDGLLYVSPQTSAEETLNYLGNREKPQADVVVYDQVALMTTSVNVQVLLDLIHVMSNSTSHHGSVGWMADGNTFQRLATRFTDQDDARLLAMSLFLLPNVVLPFYGDGFLLKSNNDVTMEWNISDSVWQPKSNLISGYSELARNRSSLTAFEHTPKVFYSQKEFLSLIYDDDVLVGVNFSNQTVKTPTNGTSKMKGRYLFHTNAALSGTEVDINKSFDVGSSQLFIMKLFS